MESTIILKLINKKLKALGLVEILASIAIFGGVIVVLTALTLTAYRTVKNDELVDAATGVMVNGLEFFKSTQANTLLTDPAFGVNSTRVYYFNAGNVTYTTSLPLLSANPLNCTTSAAYKVNLQIPLTTPISGPSPTASALAAFLVCNEIEVKKNADKSFNLRSVLVYQIGKTYTQTELNGYRPAITN
jgi:type II secretory pathway pseudopilin PulG